MVAFEFTLFPPYVRIRYRILKVGLLLVDILATRTRRSAELGLRDR